MKAARLPTLAAVTCLAEGVGIPAIGEHEFADTLRKDGVQ